MGSEQMMVLLNLVTCLAGSYLCVCRMTHMNSHVKLPIRLGVTLQFALFAASGLSYTYNEPASFIQWMMGFGLICILLLGYGSWRHGAPAYAVKA
jgi:hypothetical protein